MNWLGVLIGVLDIFSILSVLLGRGGVGHKILWTLMILILPVIGLILYLVLGRSAADAG